MAMTEESQSFDRDYAVRGGDALLDAWTDGAIAAAERDWQEPACNIAVPVEVPICLVFASGETASQLLLAVPVLARALRNVHLAGWAQCAVFAGPGWQPAAATAREIARLAPGLRVIYCDCAPPAGATLIVNGEELTLPHRLQAAAKGTSGAASRRMLGFPPLTVSAARELLRQKSRDLLAETAKPGDGIVTRYLNRPISQGLTRLLLRWFGAIDPNLASAGTAVIGLAMFACLLSYPGSTGLILGALLFQLASVFDGVDGEIARATFRATPRGASVDSLVDAATNILFFTGVVINLYSQGDRLTAATALVALGGLAFGTVLLGIAARRQHGGIDFNSVKQLVAPERSRVMQVLTWLTMRDFYAFAAAVLIVVGMVVPAVWAFAIMVAGWLVVVLYKLAPKGKAAGYAQATCP